MGLAVTLENTRTLIVGDLPVDTAKHLIDMLSFYVDGYEYTSAYELSQYRIKGGWDGKNHLFKYDYKKSRGYCPAGLTYYLFRILDEAGLLYTTTDRRFKAEIGEPELPLHGLIPRDYQHLGLTEFLRIKRIVWQAATGAGKSLMIAMAAAKINAPTQIYVTTIDLMEQMHEDLTAALQIPIGRIGGGLCEIEQINVCMVPTAAQALGFKYQRYDTSEPLPSKLTEVAEQKKQITTVIAEARLVIFDECHHMRAITIQKIAKASKKAAFRIGASATPFRDAGDDLLIEAQLGPSIFNITASYLIKNRFLVRPTIKWLQVPTVRFPKGTKYPEIYQQYIVESTIRNQMILDKAKEMHAAGRKILITVARRDTHGKTLLGLLAPHMKVRFLHGRVDKEDRKQILADMKSGTLDCLIGTSLADEGLNVPIISGVILAGGGKSRTRIFQRIGRALRLHASKTDALIYSFIDNARYLRKHSYDLISLLKTEPEFKVLVAREQIDNIRQHMIKQQEVMPRTAREVYRDGKEKTKTVL